MLEKLIDEDEEGKAAVGFLQVDEDEEGKAAVGFLQVDEDEEGIGAGFDFEPSIKPSSHWVPAAAGFLQVLGSKVLGLISNPASTGFRFEPNNRWVNGSVEFHLFIDLLYVGFCFKLSSCAEFDFKPTKHWVLFPTQLQLDRRIY
ncbi:hypothetical protein SLEP1_g12733 [Rubroshorea leprosula]|uniref:Uncharacterized protein n=1 Tax=Rubroshorea leprosula TaxID=152421 RepID=A0AAV5IN89_9ROSI|nr:hypothetical protein SLEP1_g12733 [Rubroshorea leprosula]